MGLVSGWCGWDSIGSWQGLGPQRPASLGFLLCNQQNPLGPKFPLRVLSRRCIVEGMENPTCSACLAGYHESPGAGPCSCPCHGTQPQPKAPVPTPRQHIHPQDFPESGSSGPQFTHTVNCPNPTEDAKALAFVKECGYRAQGLVGYDKVTAVELLIALGKALNHHLITLRKDRDEWVFTAKGLREQLEAKPLAPALSEVVYLAVSLSPIRDSAPNPAPGGSSPGR